LIGLKVDPASVDRTVEYLNAVRLRIFEQVRLGMQEAMDGLAGTALVEMTAAGIQERTGELAGNIAKSPRVRETATTITGRVTAERKMTLKGRTFMGYVGTALDEGYAVPGVEGNLLQFSGPDGETLYRRGHVAFDVRPHPFLRQASDAYQPTLMDIIAERVAAACED